MHNLNEINWFPGHMKKALDQVSQKIKECDGVIEIGDARAPFSSFPEYLDKITENKEKVFIFSKADLADPVLLSKQKDIYKSKGIECFSFDLRDPNSAKEMLRYLSNIQTTKDRKYIRLGFPLPVKRFIVLGIPNVGKSTFINSLSCKKKAAVENKPGKTRTETLIKVSQKVEIFDAPGILEPNYENKTVIAKLALLGSVKMEVLPLIPLTDYLMEIISSRYSKNLVDRYGIEVSSSPEENYSRIATNRKFLLSGSLPDTDRARNVVLKEFRAGQIGKISLDE
ncbi:MAG: ribosome biogenesis GTPase YlqF [Bacilli bacterium]|jgi:ribosome biogenesis GTPase A